MKKFYSFQLFVNFSTDSDFEKTDHCIVLWALLCTCTCKSALLDDPASVIDNVLNRDHLWLYHPSPRLEADQEVQPAPRAVEAAFHRQYGNTGYGVSSPGIQNWCSSELSKIGHHFRF